MVTEHVIFTIKADAIDRFIEAMVEGCAILGAAEGAGNVVLHRGVEHASQFLLLIEWDDIDDHIAFTKQPQFQAFAGLVGDCFDGKPAMQHFQKV